MNVRMKEIGVDANPSKPGSYEVIIDGICSMVAIKLDFDGQSWDIYREFQGKRIWWIDTVTE